MRSTRCKATGKRRFRDEIAAKLALAEMQRAGRDEKRCYFCPSCRGWHVTSEPLKERKDPKALTSSCRVS